MLETSKTLFAELAVMQGNGEVVRLAESFVAACRAGYPWQRQQIDLFGQRDESPPPFLRLLHLCGYLAGLRFSAFTPVRRISAVAALEMMPGYDPALLAIRTYQARLRQPDFTTVYIHDDEVGHLQPGDGINKLIVSRLTNGMDHALYTVCSLGSVPSDQRLERLSDDLTMHCALCTADGAFSVTPFLAAFEHLKPDLAALLVMHGSGDSFQVAVAQLHALLQKTPSLA